ncbi:MAG TPA: hypothetical protein VLM42_14135 [Bryobacteraceae bacterium]|nr:hypothetical protein [Bryobacteraceae bacterium]
MKRHKIDADRQKFIDDIKSQQQNTLWPDTVRNGRSVDEFLWKGSPRATLIQRMGAWLIGAFFLFVGVVFLGFARTANSWILAIIACVWLLPGAKIFSNGFRKHLRPADQDVSLARRLFPGYFSTLTALKTSARAMTVCLAAKSKKVKTQD